MPVHTLKLVSFLSSTKTELSHGKVAPSWRDLFAGTGTSSVTPFSGFSSQVLSAAIAWSILRMPDVFISRTFGHTSLETIQLRCIGKGHVVLILSSTPNSQFPPIPLRQASTNAATYLSKLLGFELEIELLNMETPTMKELEESVSYFPLPLKLPGWPRDEDLFLALEERFISPIAGHFGPQSGPVDLAGLRWVVAPLALMSMISALSTYESRPADLKDQKDPSKPAERMYSSTGHWVWCIYKSFSSSHQTASSPSDPFSLQHSVRLLGIEEEFFGLADALEARKDIRILKEKEERMVIKIRALYNPKMLLK